MRRTLAALLFPVLAAWPVYSAEDDPTSLSYIAYMERYATVEAAAQGGTLDAQINMPVLPGDRVDSAREARLEIVLADGSTVWMDEYTSLAFDAVAFSRGNDAKRTVLFLADGVAAVEIPADALVERPTRVDTRKATVYLTKPGLYRLEALPQGGLRVEAWSGLAEVMTPAGGVLVRAGTAAESADQEVVRTEAVLTRNDSFGRWVMERSGERGDATSRHLGERLARQGAVLDRYGTWVWLEDLETWAWRPDVDPTWTPYWYGRWYWTPAGWTWISYEPWGWLPYHYGSWYLHASLGWIWCWDPVWGPAWVDWIWWPGYVGWCPLGYYDWWWWNSGWWNPVPLPGRGRTRPGSRVEQPLPSGPVRPLPRGETRRLARPASDGSRSTPPSPLRHTLDLRGTTRLDRIDGKPWRVVRVEDFASPHLPRLARPLEEVRRHLPSTVARVVSGPLVTPSPGRSRTASVVERTFRSFPAERRDDLTPLLARSGGDDLSHLAHTVRLVDRHRLLQGRVHTPGDTVSQPRDTTTAPRPSHDRPNVHRPRIVPGAISARPAAPRPDGRGLGTPPRVSRPPASYRPPSPRPSNPTVAPRRRGSVLRHSAPSSRSVPAPSRSIRSPASTRKPTVRLPSRSSSGYRSRSPRTAPRTAPRSPGPRHPSKPGRR